MPKNHPKIEIKRGKSYPANDIAKIAAQHRIPVSGAQLQDYLRVSRVVATSILDDLAIKPGMGGRYDMRGVWLTIWGIRDVPGHGLAEMLKPLMTVGEVAELAGVSERTIRRAGDGKSSAWALPRHHDFGPRTRRYLKPLVDAWASQVAPAPWLLPAPRKAILAGGLRMRAASPPCDLSIKRQVRI